MSKVHKENGGYIGIDYRQASPSGIYVLGGVGRTTDVLIDVELYGGKGEDYFIGPSVLDPNSPSRKGGSGGYTKFRLICPSGYTLQVRPNYVTASDPIWQRGGSGSAVLIENQWLGVAGGGGGAAGRYLYDSSTTSFVSLNVNPGGAGQGGYGLGSPSNGAGGGTCRYTSGNLSGGSEAGNGGGGAPGGTSDGSACYGSVYNPGPYGGGGGGGGNLRIYKDQSVTSGYLSVLPDVYMEYTTHSNGTHTGGPQVKITNVASGQNYTYTSSTDIGVSFIAADIFVP